MLKLRAKKAYRAIRKRLAMRYCDYCKYAPWYTRDGGVIDRIPCLKHG